MASAEATHGKTANGIDKSQVLGRYEEERVKRLRDDGINQFIDISLSNKFQHFQKDPWVDDSLVKDVQIMFPDQRCELLIVGAGWGGLLYGIRMIEAGIRLENIRIIDAAGGFGGTWYFNRYPGLSCDIESYIYLPLLEETGYMPKQRFASGEEIRHYANFVAKKYGLVNNSVLQTKAEKLVWDEAKKEWQVELVQRRTGTPPQTLNVRSQFVALSNGVLNWPKLPGLAGISDFQGPIFHTSRWDYSVTGGSPENPSLEKLKDKRVAIIGTGATACQVIPYLANWSKHLNVIQRTPASVDKRGQRETDPEWFKKEVANSPGWQRERMGNFNKHFTTGQQPEKNLVADGWTSAIGMVPISGDPMGPNSMEELPDYVRGLHDIDLPRGNRIRNLVEQEVKDPSLAEKLKAWYPTWCKRPCFHDEYYQNFNRENVTLIDSAGKGADRLTADSVVVAGTAYPVDVVIFATGFRAPFGGTPAEKGNFTITGVGGRSMTKEWAAHGPTTLHGVLDHKFPNLFLSGPWQASTSGNFVQNLDELAKHGAYILAEAKKRRAGDAAGPLVVYPSADAVNDWGLQILMRSPVGAALLGCTPSYFNLEGMMDKTPPEAQMIVARSGLWGKGIENYLEHVEAWRKEGTMKGIVVC